MERVVKQKEMFLSALSTLFHSWGSDTPDEVYWGANELLDWYEAEFNISLGIRFDVDQSDYGSNYLAVIEAIKNS